MTIPITTRKAGPYFCDGTITEFPFAFKVFSESELVVTHYILTTGIETRLLLSSDYTVSLNSDQETSPGGTITTIGAPYPDGALVTITSDIPATQNLELTSGGGFYPGVINNALDRITIIIQQALEKLSRAVIVPVSSAISPDALIARLEAIAAAMAEYPAGVTPPDITSQAYTAFTTGGVAGTLTLTPTVALSSYTAGIRYRVKFSAASTGADTLNISGLGARSIKQYDAAGAKVAAVFALGTLADVEYDGTHMVLIDQLPPATMALSHALICQTVISGPVNAQGAANLGGAIGATWVSSSNVSASDPLVVTAANGKSAGNFLPSNVIGWSTEPLLWTGLSTNGTMYLYVNVSESGVLTAGATVFAPLYQMGGTARITNGAYTYLIHHGEMRIGTGAASVPVTRVFVGEVTVTGGQVSAIVWYAYNGFYMGAWTDILPVANTLTTVTHALGVIPLKWALEAKCLTAESIYAVDDVIQGLYGKNTSNTLTSPVSMIFTRKTARFNSPASTSATWMEQEGVFLTRTRWSYRVTASRGW